jgi:hypothetical protein
MVREPHVVVAVFALSVSVLAQPAPVVLSLEPANGAEVDAGKVARLIVKFDRAMGTGISLCGGGPNFPVGRGRPQWVDERTLAWEVELQPDHQYRLSINSQTAQNTRSKAGVPLAPVAWSFTTLPARLRPAAEQKQRNQRAVDRLLQELSERYSHRELRVADWRPLEKELRQQALAARTDRGFAQAVATALRPTGDLHLWFTIGEQTYAAGSRAVDTLYRRDMVDREVKVAPAGPVALAGRTDDGIGYLMIAAWDQRAEPAELDQAIAGLLDTKAMVIDARPNSGGDERRAQQVAAWFVRGTVAYAKYRTRQRAGQDGFGPVQTRQLTGRPDGQRYDLPIAVLIGPGIMSSNESFVMMLQQAKDCVTVGQPTYGSSGNPQAVDLGNGVTAFIPSWQDLDLEERPLEGKGIAPDVLVPCSAADLQRGDPILAKALALLRQKVAGG